MPYSTTSKNLPANVKEMPAKQKAQWVAIFNSSVESGDDEETAFKKANGSVKEKGYVDSWDMHERRVDQGNAQYNSIGGLSGGQACANCNWFVSPDGCVIVNGDISPTGKSNFWLAQQTYEQTPIPVTIIKDAEGTNISSAASSDAEQKPGLIEVFIAKVKSFGASLRPSVAQEHAGVRSGIVFYKSDEGIRFFARASNNYKDKHKEIISAAAHNDYVNWAEKQATYPDLLLWHVPSARVGAVDWMDYADGMLCASGIVDKAYEPIAEKLANQEVGVSLGFFGIPNADGVYERYRAFEMSVLPLANAANPWTSFTLLENDMAFSEQRKTWLTEKMGVSADTVQAWEAETTKAAESLKALNIEYKAEEATSITDELREQQTVIVKLAEAIKTLTDNQIALDTQNKSLEAQVKKSQDEVVAAAITAKVAPTGATAPTERTDNVVNKEALPATQNSPTWFQEIVVPQISPVRS